MSSLSAMVLIKPSFTRRRECLGRRTAANEPVAVPTTPLPPPPPLSTFFYFSLTHFNHSVNSEISSCPSRELLVFLQEGIEILYKKEEKTRSQSGPLHPCHAVNWSGNVPFNPSIFFALPPPLLQPTTGCRYLRHWLQVPATASSRYLWYRLQVPSTIYIVNIYLKLILFVLVFNSVQDSVYRDCVTSVLLAKRGIIR